MATREEVDPRVASEQQHQRHTHPETVAVPEARGEHRGTELDVRRDAKLHRAVDEVTTDLRGTAERRRPCGDTKSGANLTTLPSDRSSQLAAHPHFKGAVTTACIPWGTDGGAHSPRHWRQAHRPTRNLKLNPEIGELTTPLQRPTTRLPLSRGAAPRDSQSGF